ncbi:hypothetical protein Q3G72_010478 [Acer saccharum]|nr:hypothetical protein Q3G72_010478 [Acer saccharum]
MQRFLNTMRAVQGALIVASSIQIILGYSQLWGICSRFFSPLGMVPVISLVGFGLFDRGFPVVGRCVEIGIPMLILFIAFSQYLKNFQTRQMPILESQWCIQTSFRRYLISSAPWIKIPYPLQWGAPTFDAGHAFGMMAAVLVSLIESTGAYKAASRLASATPPPAHVLSHGIGWQGIGILLSGLFGTLSGCTVSVENVGLLGSTRVGSRRVIQISTGFMIFFSMLDNSLDYKDSARDRGMPWWVKFWTFKGDSRNEEFYTLPFNLNCFFPPS